MLCMRPDKQRRSAPASDEGTCHDVRETAENIAKAIDSMAEEIAKRSVPSGDEFLPRMVELLPP